SSQAPASTAGTSTAASSTAAQPAIGAIEKIPIRGPGLKIAENMAASISVPTATSQRQVSVKLLDENRRLINGHLKAGGRRVSFTHLIAQALIKALAQFPQLNDSFEERDGASYRVRSSSINIGLAVDVTRKDGSRSLLVPNIKAAEKLSFP